MKTPILFTTFIVLFIIVFTACSKSSTAKDGDGSGITFSCTGIAPTFSGDVQPILNTVCSINSSCHAGGSTNFGGSLTNHAEVSIKKADIRAQILSGNMPQNTSLTQTQINAFICWIDSGAPNN